MGTPPARARAPRGPRWKRVLRWASSTPTTVAPAAVDVELGGQRIAAGDKVTLWWSSANRDEDVFADPFRFDVRRNPNRHLAIGHGSHFCLGGILARLEIRLVLEALLARVDRCRLAGPVEWTRSNKHTGGPSHADRAHRARSLDPRRAR
jgi:cytochrome P450